MEVAAEGRDGDRDHLVADELVEDRVMGIEDAGRGVVEAAHEPLELAGTHPFGEGGRAADVRERVGGTARWWRSEAILKVAVAGVLTGPGTDDRRARFHGFGLGAGLSLIGEGRYRSRMVSEGTGGERDDARRWDER